jgi:hypothetical protein
MRKRALVFLFVLAAIAPRVLHAQSALAEQQVTRYHNGDNPAWASPSFDDSSWPVAPNGIWQIPPVHSDGFVWIRTRVPVYAAASGSLAIRVSDLGSNPGAYRIFLNGHDVGGEGGFPSAGQPVYLRRSAVFLLPAWIAVPGTTAVVAMRLWYVPYENLSGGRNQLQFRISDSETARLGQRADIQAEILDLVPDLALNTLLALVGLGLLVFWVPTRRRELLWCAALLISYPLVQWFWDVTSANFFSTPFREWTLLQVLLTIPTMFATVEFVWTVHRLRAPGWRRAAHLSWILYNAAILVAASAILASPLERWSHLAVVVFVQIFNAITLGANLWVLLVRRYNRAIAAAMCVIPIASGLGYFGRWQSWGIGAVHIELFDIGFLLSGFAVAAMLIQRAVRAWREGNDLRVEFEAAREIQQQLVTAAPKIPGFTINSVYAPAKQVGGDFYRILPDPAGGVLLVVGDVSGKGLPAAMTVSAIMGALRTLPSVGPAEVLSALNRSLVDNLRGGFVTCCAMRIAKDGSVQAANAGHLAPYCNGQEIPLEPGLPLGVAASTEYSESAFVLPPGQTLAFISDGVVEAQSATGELYGFDRTRAISTQTAEEIARAASTFGQQDDITVLTLQFAPAEVLHG